MKKFIAIVGLFGQVTLSGVYGETYKAPDLIGHWAMDEGKGNTLLSRKEGEANGVAKDIEWISGYTGNTGKAAYCDGVKSSIELPTPKLTTDTITISGWFKNEGERREYTRLIAGGPLEVGISKLAGIAYRWGDKSANPEPTLNLQPNQWIFMALSIAPDSSTLFIHNGVTMEEAKYEGVHGKVNLDRSMVLGKGEKDRNNYTGGVSGIRIHNTALSREQVLTMYFGDTGRVMWARGIKPLELSIERNCMVGTAVGKVETPLGENDWRLSLVKGNDSDLFQLDSLTGTLKLMSALDPSTKTRFNLEIKAEGKDGRSGSMIVHITSKSAINEVSKWRTEHNLKSNSWENEDNDNDGMSNLAEYGFGTDPNDASSIYKPDKPVLVNDNGIDWFHLSYKRLQSASLRGVKYCVQYKTTHSEWQRDLVEEYYVRQLEGEMELVTVRFPAGTARESLGRVLISPNNPIYSVESPRSELVLSENTRHDAVYPDYFEGAMPQGPVDVNPPWLHANMPGVLKQSKKGERLYHFKLSKDKALRDAVLSSPPKKWSFFNPYAKLDVGQWYWTFGVSSIDSPTKIEWSQETYTFPIDGSERVDVAPSADAVYDKILSLKGPRIDIYTGAASPEEITQRQAMVDEVLKDAERAFGRKRSNAEQVLLIGYAMLKDPRCKKPLVDRLWRELESVGLKDDPNFNKKGLFEMAHRLSAVRSLLEVMPEEFTPEQTKLLIEGIYNFATKGEDGFDFLFNSFEHQMYDSHVDQFGIDTLLMNSIFLVGRHDEAEKLLKYSYELWLYRNPLGGRTDGGFLNDNGYFDVSEGQLMRDPWVLSKLMDYNYFNHPWYHNSSKYAIYSNTPGNPGSMYGDGAWDGYPTSTRNSINGNLAQLLATISPENHWFRWQNNNQPIDPLTTHPVLFAAKKTIPSSNVPRLEPPLRTAMLFPDIGYASMHTDILTPEKNLAVTFRSSPFGNSKHVHASQNAFNTAFGGKKLFFRTGWRKKEGKDENYLHSRGFNLILPDGQGQVRSVASNGYMPRFVNGERMTYSLGEASETYPESVALTRFRRHLVHLKPHYLVVYDELVSAKEIPWTYCLKAHDKITKTSDNVVSVHNGMGLGVANLFCGTQLSTEVTNLFYEVPNKLANEADNHWHSYSTTTKPSRGIRFLNVIDIRPSNDKNEPAVPLEKRGVDLITTKVGDFTISAQINTDKPPYLKIVSDDGSCSLLYGDGDRELDINKTKKLKSRLPFSTLFVETGTKFGDIVTESVDNLPDAAIYGNLY